ncbi:probable alcohol dehydrogenase (plasmid) [Rhodococcus jostii RHA1]|jgi:zinc-binding alcohol dehydrogenase/oxidoreductase|uniref:Alcohol dehydrogenase n=2 Tax=Rhodococcus TaxID=1827 RepID=I0WIW0_RHOOP|nr:MULTISPECIES: zinc-binding dehydrogenase [Rhodococcus]ABG99671.1 probable alcohol dehydrogenase [Rhodococcus jostii RHA1]EID76326.1 alcohol dehydrogenase [Rhodococcus opacus RKJ300 = JCM 13270]QQZ18942.1 zinc-binding dehydrogenase [Rhodococcus sp. 21391]
MIAVTHTKIPGPAGVAVVDDAPESESPGENDAVLALSAAGLNRHELFLVNNRTGTEPPLILGADGVGTVTQVGSPAHAALVGTTVLIDPCIGWPDDTQLPEVPEILGGPRPGTFAQRITVPLNNIHPVPPHLTRHEAAALGLSASTAYRALFTRGGLQPSEHVMITGISGGVGPLALAFAVAAGAEVTVITRRHDSADRARQLGAAHAIVGADDFEEALTRRADLVVDSVGGSVFGSALRALRPGGRVVTFGATTGADVPISLRDLFFRQIDIRGTSMGNAHDFRAMLEFVEHHKIRPVIDTVYPLAAAPEVFAAMDTAPGFGKTVFDIEGTPRS